ncbi:MAG: gentisate 1,2-dioxygenase [Erythrobacter sp.]|uniref:gentisate 1,2-dioxygenase n=1 Tax=Erythrobacter sp. TaxID=1042 RepID=UPI00262E6425|nr:gentisate 1,2-dioxygenase [Erythrobacter sp.]MDJ0978159.1 gentisate 1,2-dioxygenase [Erythrobacter sp.]
MDKAALGAFYDRIAKQDMAPLWESLHVLVSQEPATPVAPVHWSYSEAIRPALMESGNLITAEEAERRVLILENPGLKGQGAATNSLYAGMQLLLPGEVAPCHRHTQTALRFVIEGEGAYTSVDGERTPMSPGDMVITPQWTWHDHGNETDRPMVWLDGLDIPMVRFFGSSFAQGGNTAQQPISRPVGDSRARFASNLLPHGWERSRAGSPIFNYRYADTRPALATLARNDTPDPHFGHRMRYIDPTTGGDAMPTMAAAIQLLPQGFETRPTRSTDATIFVVVEGEGESRIGDETFAWQPHDVFVAPSWAWRSHSAKSEAVLFSFSDAGVQRHCGLWRQELANPDKENV